MSIELPDIQSSILDYIATGVSFNDAVACVLDTWDATARGPVPAKYKLVSELLGDAEFAKSLQVLAELVEAHSKSLLTLQYGGLSRQRRASDAARIYEITAAQTEQSASQISEFVELIERQMSLE